MKTRWHKQVSRNIRRRLRESLLGKHGIALLADTKNGLLTVDASDFNVGRQLLNKGEYDWAEVQWLAGLLNQKEANIVVVGSHIGALVVPLSEHCRRILAFEADAANYRLLQCNLVLNDCQNVRALNQAAGEAHRKVHISRNPVNTGNSAVSQRGHGTQETQMVCLDDAVDFDSVQLMIMDIEGYELHALQGATQVLKKTEMLYIEYAPQQLSEFGSSRQDIIELLFSEYSHMHVFSSGEVQEFGRERGIAWLEELHRKKNGKGYLRNLLFARKRLLD